MSNFFIDQICREARAKDLSDIIAYQSRDANDMLNNHIRLIKRKGDWEDLGIPKEIARLENNKQDSLSSFLDADFGVKEV